jgi:large subunit ribosomal protein L4
LALRIALSDKARNGKLIVVDDFKASKYSTKHVTKLLSAFKVSKALVADEQNNEFLYRSARNIHGVASVPSKDVCVHALLKHESLLISERGLLAIQARCEEG